MKSLAPNFLTSWKRAQSIASGENSFFSRADFSVLFFYVTFLFYLKVPFHYFFFFFSLKEKLRMM